MTDPMKHSYSKQSSQWGGILLGVGALAYVLAVVIFILQYGQPNASGPDGVTSTADRVGHYLQHQGLAHAMWFIELLAALLIAVGSLTLQHRTYRERGRISGIAAWNIVGLGGVILILMYLIMLGGYPEASSAFSSEPGLFTTLNAVTTFIFSLGNAVVFFGLTLLFSVESNVSVSSWLGRVGAIISLVSFSGSVGLLIGVSAFEALAPLGLVAFLMTAYLGFSIWRTAAERSSV